SAGSSVAQSARSGASSVGGWSNIGYNMTSGIASGIRSGMGIVTGAIRCVVSNAVATARKVAQIHSPSRLFAKMVGKYFPSGIAEGALDNQGVLNKAMDNMINDSIPSMPKLNYNLGAYTSKMKAMFSPSIVGAGGSTSNTTNNSTHADNRQYNVNVNGNSNNNTLTVEDYKRIARELAYYTQKTEGGRL